MPLFTTLAALSQTAASNPPDGSVDAPSTIDDQLRLLGSFVAQLRDGAGFTVTALMPPGSMLDFGGAVPPAGFLLCDGAAVSRTTYAPLFAAIGTIWGAGDGSTTFNVPNMQRRVSIGAGGAAGAAISNTTGSIGGEEAHPLTTAELAAHLHGVSITSGGNSVDHTHTGTTGTESVLHTHGVNDPGHAHTQQSGGQNVGNGAFADAALRNQVNTGTSVTGISLGTESALHTHDITTGGASAAHTHLVSGNTANSGSGTAHNNMQPSAVVTKIIKI